MNYEESRLRTFRNWPPTAEVEPFRVAMAGFFFTGQGVEVQCFRCGGKISEWNYGDQVMARHRRLDPQCPFVIDPATSGNVPYLATRPGRAAGVEGEVVQPTDEGVPPNGDEIYKNEALRLLSFVNWPVSYISRESLALAGFYYMGGARGGASDKVRCAWCGGELENWLRGDKPIAEHLRHYPQCQYAKDKAQALNRTDATSPQACNNELLVQSNLAELGIHAHKTVRQQKYFTYDARLRTFENWPTNLLQKPEALAEAGFYYIGANDQVRCFHCDGGLCRWVPEDDPWIEHAKWFSNCGFVNLVKGKEFIDRHKINSGKQGGVGGGGSGRVRLVRDANVEQFMSGSCAMAALHCGLQPERVRRALRVRLQETGTPFTSTDALIDAALNEQINETPFSPLAAEPAGPGPSSARSSAARFPVDDAAIDHVTRMIIDSALSEEEVHAPPPTSWSSAMHVDPTTNNIQALPGEAFDVAGDGQSGGDPVQANSEQAEESGGNTTDEKTKGGTGMVKSPSTSSAVMLEEENRQLKEARMCKVCMDEEVGVVFLPCGHLVSCVTCAVCLPQCPLCRASVKGVVRTYLS